MSDIRFNRWLHQSGTGGVYQDSTGNIGIGTSVPTSALDVQSGTIKIGSNTLSSSGVSTFTTVNATRIVGVSTAGINTAYISTLSGISTIDASASIGINQNLVFASGKGIDFSATANSSGTMTSELLSDYEEGTWTPTLTFGGGSTGLIYNVRQGNYTKVGNRVHASCVIWLSNKGSSTGNNSVTGLPYVVRQTGGGANFISVAAQYGDRITPYHCFAPNDGTSLSITTRPTGPASSVVSLSNSDWANDTYMALHFSYRTDA